MSKRIAVLYRMKLPDHECPLGLLARRMLQDAGFDIDEHLLTSRDEVEAFKSEQQVATTPIIVIGDERIDGSQELAHWLETATA